MTDKLYLLTETELREALFEAIEMGAGADPEWDADYHVNILIKDFTPLSPDWSKAPEWAVEMRLSWECVGDGTPRPSEDEYHLPPVTDWRPRPEVK